jgi:hypothetical protein
MVLLFCAYMPRLFMSCMDWLTCPTMEGLTVPRDNCWEDTTEDTEEDEVVPMMESWDGWMEGIEPSSTRPREN